MNFGRLLYVLGAAVLLGGLPILSYLAHLYRELGRVNTGRVHEHLDIFEAEIESRFGLERRKAAPTFALLSHLWLALVVLETTRGVVYFVPGTWEAFVELFVFVGVEVALGMHFIPEVLLARTTGRWLLPLIPLIRICAWLVWPLRALLELAGSVANLSDEEQGAAEGRRSDAEGIEALVEAAEEEGILERDQAELIEQVVEFSDKRVREVMTPRPDIVAVPASATVEQLRHLLVQTKLSRVPVHEGSLEEIVGVVFARDLLQIPERDAGQRQVRELVHPVLFVPETKLGSELLKEMRQKNQAMAVVVDEHGSVAGLATIEDLVEEIVGESNEDGRHPSPDVLREADGSLVFRGSIALDKAQELLGVSLTRQSEEAAMTLGGLLNHVAGRVPALGEKITVQGFQFEVLEANQRKILRIRARRSASGAAQPASAS